MDGKSVEATTENISTLAAVKVTVTEYFLSTTAHALPNIFRTSSIILKVMWLLCFLASTGYCIYSMSKSLQDFLSYPSYISTSIVQDIPAQFPAVTICSIKALNNIAALNYIFTPQFAPYLLDPSFFQYPAQFYLYQTYMIRTAIGNDATLNYTSKKNFGFKIEDMLISCMFNYQTCNVNDFTYYYDTLYGNCYTFNKGVDNYGNKTHIKQVSVAGPFYGLILEAFLGAPLKEQTYFNSNDGLLISIHNQTSKPFTNGKIMVATAADTDIVVSKNFIKKLEKPYGDCLMDTSATSSFNSYLFNYIVRTAGIEYSQRYCFDLCIQNEIIKTCNCSNTFMPLFKDNVKLCLLPTETTCVIQLVGTFGDDLDKVSACKAQCPFECETIDYETIISKAFYPTQYYREILYNNTNIKFSGISLSELHESVAKVNVYFKSMEYKVTEQNVQTTTEDFFSNVGGTLGLYIGISLLSVVELVELGFNLVIAIVSTMKRKGTVANVQVKNVSSAPPAHTFDNTSTHRQHIENKSQLHYIA